VSAAPAGPSGPLTEREKMRAGLPYRPGDAELIALRRRAQSLMRAYNATVYGEDHARAHILGELLGTYNGAVVRPWFSVDYGVNIHCAPGVFFNYNCVVLDVCDVTIGEGTQIGPMVQILTADHPRDATIRSEGLENGKPITIGAHVWIGGGAILLPGVTVGDGAVIGAGAVVTRDVAPHSTVAGNPARPIGSP
jgi:maltose O-acetyltransferase